MTDSATGGRSGWKTTSVHLLLAAAFVVWFYWPWFYPGLPAGEFGSYVMGSDVGRRLIAHPLSFPSWNPWLMCGRPTIGFMSPFRALELPLGGLDPIARMKALLVLYNVLAGWAMYALLLDSRAGRGAALFGALVYPVMPSTVARCAVLGQIHIPMFYALLPLLVLALFRLRRKELFGVVVLGLGLALGFVRDAQRTLLFLVMLGLLLGLSVLLNALTGRRDPDRRQRAHRHALVLLALAGAFALGVAIDSFELVNGFVGDPYRGGYLRGEEAHLMDKWSLDNLYTLVDRKGLLAGRLAPVGGGELFYRSLSRYLGVSLVLLLLAGLVTPGWQGERKARFWLVFGLLPLSLWLSFGASPLGPKLLQRWTAVLRATGVPLWLRLSVVLVAAAALVLGVTTLARNAGFRGRRWPKAVAAALGLAALLLLTAPLPLVKRLVFFLRDFRNPDWFQVSVAPFVAVFVAALVVGGITTRLGTRAPRTLLTGLLLVMVLVDVGAYRALLRRAQRSAQAVEQLARAFEVIGRDPDAVRVVSAERGSAIADLGIIWHGKPLAWDHRTYTAPRRTLRWFEDFHLLVARGPATRPVSLLAGLAGARYIVDQPGFNVDLEPSEWLQPVWDSPRLRIFRNEDWQPWLRAYPTTHLLLGADRDGPTLTAILSLSQIGLIQLESLDEGDPLLGAAARIWTDAESLDSGRHPPGALVPTLERLRELEPVAFGRPPRLQASRPSPEHVRVEVESGQPLLVVVAESYHPWWQARLDGKPAPLYPAQYAFLGLQVPEGRHTIELHLRRPWSYWLWGVVSLVSLAAALGFLLLRRRTSGRGQLLLDEQA